jgi:hypothetical protein
MIQLLTQLYGDAKAGNLDEIVIDVPQGLIAIGDLLGLWVAWIAEYGQQLSPELSADIQARAIDAMARAFVEFVFRTEGVDGAFREFLQRQALESYRRDTEPGD